MSLVKESKMNGQEGRAERRLAVSMTRLTNTYEIYGLRLASSIVFPELPGLGDAIGTDATIRATSLPEVLPGARYYADWVQATARDCQLEISDIGRFRINDGREVLVDRRLNSNTAVTDGDLRLFLLGSVLSVLLHQRAWLPLHVSSVVTPAGVWAFTGDSGAGKSTIAAWLNVSRNWTIHSDDVAVVKPEEADPILYPGPRKIKLWKDTVNALGIDFNGLTRDYSRADKFHVSIDVSAPTAPVKLKVLVQLCKCAFGDSPRLVEVTGAEAFKIVCAALYRPEFSCLFNGPEVRFANIAKLAGSIRVLKFYRTWRLPDMEYSLQPLLDEIARCT